MLICYEYNYTADADIGIDDVTEDAVGIVMMKMPKPKPVVRWMKLAPMLSRNIERTMLLTKSIIVYPTSSISLILQLSEPNPAR